MDYLTKYYKERCKQVCDGLSFRTYKNVFWRVENDVFQSFGLHRSVSGADCTIEFSVAPLCGGIIDKTSFGPDHLKMFEGVYEWFEYDRTDETSIQSCVNDMCRYMERYLLPYFEASRNAEQAYASVTAFQAKNYRNGVSMFDPSLYGFALEAGMYDRALEHLLMMKKQSEDAYRINMPYASFTPSADYLERHQRKIQTLDEKIRMLTEHDDLAIRRMIEEDKAIARKNLGI